MDLRSYILRLLRRNENGLTNREQDKQDKIKEVDNLVSKGLTNKEIAEQLNLSVRQVQRLKKELAF